MENLAKNVLVNTINDIIEKVENIDPKNIISAKYDSSLDKHTIKFVDKDNMVCTISVETQGIKNTNNISTKKLSINDRHTKVKELNENGVNQIDIAKQLNVSQKTISNDLKFLDKMKKAEELYKPLEGK